MKKNLKTVFELILDQFIGIISACMLVLCVAQFFKNSQTGYILAFCVCFGFYVYATYLTAFKAGFRDQHRILKDVAYRGYLYKGALLGAGSAIPLFVVLMIYLLVTKSASLVFYFMDMYWIWPLSRIFPNHVNELLYLAFLPMIFVPWISYIAGYKNFVLFDFVIQWFKKTSSGQLNEKK